MPVNPDPSAPLVSVIVLTFNRRQLLSETLDSIRCQTYPRIEVVVVDNMSTDGTPDYIGKLDDPRIVYLRNPNNGVLAVNRNLGIRRARGRYIAFCDDDDTWLPDKLEKQIELLESAPEVAMCFTNAMAIQDSADAGRRLFRRFPRHGLFKRLIWRNFICNSSAVVRTSVFEEIGLPDESRAFTPYDDYHLWLRISSRWPVRGLDEPLVRYRVHGASYSSQLANRERVVVRVLRSSMANLRIRRPRFALSIALRLLKYLFLTLRNHARRAG
jgi:glycosyltransferase involved in cell wall biosynthesis